MVISITEYKLRNVVPGAAPTVREAKRGDVAWIPARSHTGENIGETDMAVSSWNSRSQRSEDRPSKPV